MSTIVIAEDDELLSILLIDLLEEIGHEVHAAPDGRAALTVLKHHQPDLLITDFRMPEMTGLELASVIRSDASLRELPILLISGAQSDIGRAHPGLFDIVEDKPLTIRELLRDVDWLLRRDPGVSPQPYPT